MNKKELIILGSSNAGKKTIMKNSNENNLHFQLNNQECKNKFEVNDLLIEVIDNNKLNPFKNSIDSKYIKGIIYVIDSSDKTEISEWQDSLIKIILSDFPGLPVLFLINKQDLEGSLRPNQVQEVLEIDSTTFKSKFYFQGTIATTGEGLKEGFEWISNQIIN